MSIPPKNITILHVLNIKKKKTTHTTTAKLCLGSCLDICLSKFL